MSEVDSTENKVPLDEVVEERPAAKKKGFLGTIIFVVILAAIVGAGWYFQSMWLPQVQQTYQQAQTMMHDFMTPEKVDPMAAPMPHALEDSESDKDDAEEVVAVATPVVKSEPVKVIEVEEKNGVESEDKDITETVVTASVVEAPSEPEKNDIETVTAEIEEPAIKTEAPHDVIEETESVVQATFIEATEPAVVKQEQVKEPAPVKAKQEIDLAQARQAFWQRDLPKAEALYKQQIETAHANANSWGELGNIYYLQAKWQLAARAYTEAALLLLDKGDFPQAMFMRYIVMGLDPVQVKRIDERVKALQAPLNR